MHTLPMFSLKDVEISMVEEFSMLKMPYGVRALEDFYV